MQTVTELGPQLGVAPTCAALGVARATYYRSRQPRTVPASRPIPARALSPGERQAVLDVLHEPRFMDLAPAEVYATLLDEGRDLCSERTLYRRKERGQVLQSNSGSARLPLHGPSPPIRICRCSLSRDESRQCQRGYRR